MAPIGFNPSATTPYPTATKAPASTSPAGTSIVATTPVVATPDPLLTTLTDPATGRPVRTSDATSTSDPSAITYTPNAPGTIDAAASETIKPTETEQQEIFLELDLKADERLKEHMHNAKLPNGRGFHGTETISVTVECASGRKITASRQYQFDVDSIGNGKKSALPMNVADFESS